MTVYINSKYLTPLTMEAIYTDYYEAWEESDNSFERIFLREIMSDIARAYEGLTGESIAEKLLA